MGDNKKRYWLDDDVSWHRLEDRLETRSSAAKNQQPKIKNVKSRTNTHLFFVKIRDIRISLNTFIKKVLGLCRKKTKLGASIGIIIILILASFLAKDQLFKKRGPTDSQGVLSDASIEPEFDTVLPTTSINGEGTSVVKYDSQKKVASYTDQINTINITVSQQPLPDTFKDWPDEEIEKVARSFSANHIINASKTKVYLGTSGKGPQTAIFYKKAALVFIYSEDKISDEDWAEYISDLN